VDAAPEMLARAKARVGIRRRLNDGAPYWAVLASLAGSRPGVGFAAAACTRAVLSQSADLPVSASPE